ncbi:MAG TPA: ABC transporter permease [Limnochordales bacterium]|nr:ABC transporter permease [Limnochordales bacterium]
MQRELETVPPARAVATRFDWKKWGPLWALLLLIALGAWVNPNFLSAANVTNVLARSAFTGIIAVGATFVIIAGGIDLSVGSMAAFISGVMIIAMNKAVSTMGTGWNVILLGMGLSVAVGLLAGLLNGLVTTKGKIEPFIVTLGTMGIYRSLVTYLADGGTLSLNFGLRGTYRPVYYDSLWFIPYPVLIFIIVALLGGLLLNKTRFGRYCLATGSNENVARYSAINVDRIRTWTYVLQGLCVSIATIIYVPRLGSASGQTGILWELEAIAAVIIGGTALKGGYGRIWGTVAGAVMLSLIGNILNLTDVVSQYLNGAIQGLIIMLAVLLQRGVRR